MDLTRKALPMGAICGAVTFLVFAMLAGCGGGSTNGVSSSPAATTMHAVRVTGLAPGAKLSLRNNTGESMTVSGSGAFTFQQPVNFAHGSIPQVIMEAAPAGQVCSNANGSGLVSSSNTYQTNITCSVSAQSYAISGTVKGLAGHETHPLVISDNGGNPLSLDENGIFHFSKRVARNGSYDVLVDRQPKGEVCSILNGSGSGVVRNVTNIQINCSDKVLTLGGTVSGLFAGQSIRLLDGSNSTPLIVNGNGSYTFPVGVARQGSYQVSVATQPDGGICTVVNGQGAGVKANITNVNVICTAQQFTVSGTVTGLLAGTQVTLQNNGANDLTVSGNTTFTFNTPIAFGSSYLVSIGTQPLNQLCTVQNGTGSGVQANVSNVAIVCGQALGFSVFYEFGSNGSSVDGIQPNAGLVQGADGNFYGTTYHGGAYGNTSPFGTDGTVFKITPSSTESILYSFGAAGSTDGALPESSLVFGSDGNFYGTTLFGGTCCADVNGAGTVFSLTPGGVETQLYSFPSLLNQAEGIYPNAGLMLGRDGNFYGTASQGGSFCDINGCSGVVFKMTPSGSLSVLYAFGTNGGATDGANPFGSLLQGSDGNFYGTTISGGQYNNGTVFMITPGGIESVLYSFGAAGTADGTSPRSNLIQDSAGNLYGTTFSGGVNNQGTVFKISPIGSVSILYSFGGSPDDGSQPNGGLLLASDGNLYGSTNAGGVNNNGTIYQISTAGSEKVLHSFSGSDGSNPYGQLIQARDGNLYGVTSYGGYLGNGTVFKFVM